MTKRVNLDELAKHVVVANSPTFIIDVFRRHPEVAILCNRNRESLLRSLGRLAREQINGTSFQQRAMAYAIVVALYLKNDHAAVDIAEGHTFDDWYGEIIAIIKLMMSKKHPAHVNRCLVPALAAPSRRLRSEIVLQIGSQTK